jgi:hypothetical protein
MQWHWGNIGSALQGFAAVGVAVAAIIGLIVKGPAALRAWTGRQDAEADAAREQAETERNTRRARLQGWSRHGIASFSVKLVTSPEELDHARGEVASGDPTAYLMLRVTGYGDGLNPESAQSLRRLIREEGMIARCPEAGEVEALKAGLDAMGIPRSPLA